MKRFAAAAVSLFTLMALALASLAGFPWDTTGLH